MNEKPKRPISGPYILKRDEDAELIFGLDCPKKCIPCNFLNEIMLIEYEMAHEYKYHFDELSRICEFFAENPKKCTIKNLQLLEDKYKSSVYKSYNAGKGLDMVVELRVNEYHPILPHYSPILRAGSPGGLPISEESDRSIDEYLKIMAKSDNKTETSCICHHVLDYVWATLYSAFDQGRVIKKCKHCGKYFISKNRTDEKYCRFINDRGKTCAEEVIRITQKLAKNKLINRLHKQNYDRLYKRTLTSNKYKSDKCMEEFKEYKEGYRKQKKAFKEGRISEAVMIEWLKNNGGKKNVINNDKRR